MRRCSVARNHQHQRRRVHTRRTWDNKLQGPRVEGEAAEREAQEARGGREEEEEAERVEEADGEDGAGEEEV